MRAVGGWVGRWVIKGAALRIITSRDAEEGGWLVVIAAAAGWAAAVRRREVEAQGRLSQDVCGPQALNEKSHLEHTGSQQPSGRGTVGRSKKTKLTSLPSLHSGAGVCGAPGDQGLQESSREQARCGPVGSFMAAPADAARLAAAIGLTCLMQMTGQTSS